MEKSLSQRVEEKSLKFALSGKNLISALKARDISKWRLAKDLEISYRTVQYWAKGKFPSDENIIKVSVYLGLKVSKPKTELELDKKVSELESRIKAIEKRLEAKP